MSILQVCYNLSKILILNNSHFVFSSERLLHLVRLLSDNSDCYYQNALCFLHKKCLSQRQHCYGLSPVLKVTKILNCASSNNFLKCFNAGELYKSYSLLHLTLGFSGMLDEAFGMILTRLLIGQNLVYRYLPLSSNLPYLYSTSHFGTIKNF